MTRFLTLFLLSVTFFQFVHFGGSVSAQELPTLKALQSQLSKIEANSELPAAEKARLQALLEKTISAVEEETASKKAAAQFVAETETAASDLNALRESLAAPVADSKTLVLPGEFSELETLTNKTVAARAAAILAETNFEAALKKRESLMDSLPDEIAEQRRQISAADPLPPFIPEQADYSEEGIARLLEIYQERARAAQLSAREAELAYLIATEPNLSAEGDFLARETQRLTKEAEFLSKKLSEAREAKADQDIKKAEAAADAASNAGDTDLTAFADETLRLVNLRSGPDGLLARISESATKLSQVESQLQQVATQFSSAKQRLDLLESAELTIDADTGDTLREQRALLPTVINLKKQLAAGVRETATNQLELIKIEERRRMRRLEMPETAAVTSELLDARIEALSTVMKDLRTLQGTLEARNRALKHLLDQTDVFRLYLNEKLVWIRSAAPITWGDFGAELSHAGGMFAPGSLQNWLAGLGEDILEAPAWWLLALVIFGYLFYRKRRLKAMIEVNGKAATQRSCRTFKPTLIALSYSLLRVLLLSGPIWFLVWRTCHTPAALVSARLYAPAAIFTFLVLIREFNKIPHGIFAAHLGRPETLATEVKRTATLAACLLPIPLFFAATLPAIHQTGASGRIFFIIVQLVFLYAAHRLLKPSKGILSTIGLRSPFDRIAYFATMAAPVAMIMGAALGYFSSMREISDQILASVAILFAVGLTAALLQRWVLVSRRKIAANQANAKRKAEAALEEAQADDSRSARKPQESLLEIENRAASLARVQDDTRKLIRILATTVALFAFWAVWSPSLPALSALDRVSLWSISSDEVSDSATKSETAESSTSTVSMLPISGDTAPTTARTRDEASARSFVSLQDLLVSVFILVLFFTLARQLPAVLELLVFQRLNLEPGGAFAFNTTLRYVLIGVAIALACSRLGIEWSKIQWIAAAITFGIGFGLQEIFANFVAGIIILFERPLRLGDFVTLDDISGHVTKIQIRATTIRDFSNKELVVPNREFITGKLVNWTLSDPVIRVEILVGIAYGSDTRLAEKLLLKAAGENAIVLEEPKSNVAFREFGESSLDFELRVHIKDSNMLVPVQSQLRFEIDRVFREAGIEIAFPQRDLHIRSVDHKVTEILKKEK